MRRKCKPDATRIFKALEGNAHFHRTCYATVFTGQSQNKRKPNKKDHWRNWEKQQLDTFDSVTSEDFGVCRLFQKMTALINAVRLTAGTSCNTFRYYSRWDDCTPYQGMLKYMKCLNLTTRTCISSHQSFYYFIYGKNELSLFMAFSNNCTEDTIKDNGPKGLRKKYLNY